MTERYDLNPTRGAFLAQWMTAYREAQEAARLAGFDLPAAKRAVSDARQAVERIIDDVVANGGTPTVPIDGKNPETRKAQLGRALAEYAPYAAAQKALRAVEGIADSVAAQMSDAENSLRAARLALEWGAAVAAHMAAVEGSVALERKVANRG